MKLSYDDIIKKFISENEIKESSQSHRLTEGAKYKKGQKVQYQLDRGSSKALKPSVGTISTNANSLPSDKNFKRDIKDLNIGLDLVSQLQPKSFNTIVDDENSPVMYGLIAQDLEVALEKVGVTKNSAWILQHEEKNDAKESDYSLDYSKLIPILINAIKELQVKVTALESK